jgi:hypothetical protein
VTRHSIVRSLLLAGWKGTATSKGDADVTMIDGRKVGHQGRTAAPRAEVILSGDTQKEAHPGGHRGLVVEAKVYSAKLPDQDGLRLLRDSAWSGLSRLKHLWLDAGYEGRGRRRPRRRWA